MLSLNGSTSNYYLKKRFSLSDDAIAGDSTIHQCQQMNHSKVSAWLLSQFQA
ncbi:MAG: hypothetical protein KME25_19540 [Symplocastrum torsivum CPER-KK1]|uniref:Uncharacterized protein n=1 Tax=Symplocastrum torsivum CPER-KK1 TaxID=450513 RepID=A0A951UB20_9CYAN|nr:hypothetical protein [Microcoleus sp. FACHB-SPT15]MBD1807272.1 hypothetical protein [Microcoleus sp. FACHB-SPT15]MBW4546615.1 hypothetical protein [Symplocastrum torsivum CPER-KK1]